MTSWPAVWPSSARAETSTRARRGSVTCAPPPLRGCGAPSCRRCRAGSGSTAEMYRHFSSRNMTIQNDDTNRNHRDPHDSSAKRSQGRTGLYRHFRGLKNDDTTSVHDLDSRTRPRARAFPLINEHYWRSLVGVFCLFNLDLYRHFSEITICCPLRKNVISAGYTRLLGTRAPNLLIHQQIRCTRYVPKLGTRVVTGRYGRQATYSGQ